MDFRFRWRSGRAADITAMNSRPGRVLRMELRSGERQLRRRDELTITLGPGGATAGDGRKMSNEPLEREPIDRMRARLEALRGVKGLRGLRGCER
jgi:hypothetical protein